MHQRCNVTLIDSSIVLRKKRGIAHAKTPCSLPVGLLPRAQLQPITRTVLRIALTVTPEFSWRERDHGAALRWLVWVEDSDNEHIYHRCAAGNAAHVWRRSGDLS